MVGSEVELYPTLDERVVFWPCDAQRAFLDHKLIVRDGVEWGSDMAVLRSGLIKRKRGFKQSFHGGIEPWIQDARGRVAGHAARLFREMFPSFVNDGSTGSWRPMITGPEPMHFDTYGDTAPQVVSFMNVSDKPRVYRVGESFKQLVERCPDAMRQVFGETGNFDDLSYRIRARTVKNQPPINDDSPRHTVKFAPGSIWFFNAKTVSHEVVYGEGAIAFGWPVPDCGADTQQSLMETIL